MKKVGILLCILFSVSCYAGTIYVPAQYPSIQQAINASVNYDTIIVSAGTYYENISFLGKKITLRSTDPNNASIVNSTIINGNNPADPNFGSVVIFNHGEDNNAVLAGFTITGGSGSWITVAWKFYTVYWNRCGGGVLCYNMSQPTITKNIFINNSAGQGGGIYIYGNPVNPANPQDPPIHLRPVISNNTFVNNRGIVNHGFLPPNTTYEVHDHGDGGAIVGFQGCDAIITNNTISDCFADYYGGGIHLRQWSSGEISNNHIYDNNSALGAGIHVTYNSSPHIFGNQIETNKAGGLGGGGIYVYYYSNPIIERNLITHNTSTNGAGIGTYYDSNPTIRSNLIVNNYTGAGIIVKSSASILNNTICGNIGGIDIEYGSNHLIENNIFYNCGSWGINIAQGNLPIIKYNNFWQVLKSVSGPNTTEVVGKYGNIGVNPLFFDINSNNFRITFNSFCINSGDPNFFYDTNVQDYYGNNRVLTQVCDIGANEARPAWNAQTAESYNSIQDAINDSNNGDEIIVTIGTHKGVGNRDIEYKGKSIVVRSLDPNDPQIVAKTIIDCNGTDASPHRAFNFRYNETNSAILSGLTITKGGAMYDGGAVRCYRANPTIKKCVFMNNYSTGRGGGIHCEYSNAIITDCVFTNNTVTAGDGGAVSCFYDSTATIVNCFVAGNTAVNRGGGLYAYWSSPAFINCTVVGNKSLEGGGIGSFRESNPLVANCIVRDNRAPDGNQLAIIGTLPEITEMTVANSNIQGGQAGVCVDTNMILHWGPGNIDSDPCFAQAGYWDNAGTPAEPNDDFYVTGDYHIKPASKCVNSGNNSYLPAGIDKDLDGEQRVYNSVIDMGCDEMVYSPYDLNHNGIVDEIDLSLFSDHWLATGTFDCDFYPDNHIDFKDFSIFADDWLSQSLWH